MMPQQIPETESPEDLQRRLKANMKKSKGSQLFNVPNTEEGKEIIQSIRKHLNKKDYRMILRGRGHRMGNFNYRYDLPLGESDWLAVYVKFSDDRLNRMVNARTRIIQKDLDYKVQELNFSNAKIIDMEKSYFLLESALTSEIRKRNNMRDELTKLEETIFDRIKNYLKDVWNHIKR